MAPGRPKQKIEIQNVSAPKRSSDLDSFLSEVTLDWADLDGFGAVKKYNEIVDQLSEYDEMDDDTLVTIYHDLENLLKNKKVPKSGVKEIKRAKLAVKSELLSRKDVGLEDRMIDVVENFTNPITGEKLFDIRQVVDKKTKKVTAIELTYTAAYSALERQVLEGDRNEAGIEHLADMYYEAQAAVYELRNWKTPYYDEVNEALADSWKKPFYRALRLGKEGEVRKSKKMLLKFKSQCESRGLNEEAFIYRRAIETLKTIAIIEVGNLHTRLNNLRNSLDRHSLNLKELNTTEPKLRRMIESQFEVLRVAERLLSADNSLVDLDEVLNILSGEQKVKFKRVYRGGGVKNFNKNIASSEDLKNYLKDNGVNTDNFKVYWGAQTANGFAYWRSKLGAWPYNLKTGKRLENEAQTYPASIDVLRNELPDLTDELAVENPLDIDWAKLIKFEDKGQYDQVDTLYKKHFSHNGFYQTFATKSGVDLDDFVELLSVDNPGQFEASLERYFSLNDPKYAGLKWEMKKIHKDLEEDLEDTMSEYWSRKVLLNYYGKFADKDSDDPAWDTDPKLKELKESFRIQMLHQKYEEFLIENVILKDKDYKNMAEYFERGDDIWTSEKERYQMLLTRGVPKNVLNPKRTPNRMDPLSDGIPTYDKELRSMTKEESLMLQFHVYNQDHKNFEGKLLHFTLAERDELLTKLPVDLLGIMLSAGVSNVIGKSVAMKAATWLEKLGPKFWSGLALSVDLGAARQLLLKQGFKAAFRRILWESGARIPGFFIETLVFTAMERIITNVRQGFNTRMLLDGKAFARQWGHAAVVLGTLRATNAPLTKYLSKYKGMAASVAKGATYITTDAAALTLSGAAYDSVFFGEELDKKYLSRSIKSNVIMAAGVRLGHYALKPIGKITPKGRQLQRGILAIKEQSPDAAKGVKGDTLTSLSAEINKGQPKGEVAMDHVLVGLDSSEINALAKSNTSLEFWSDLSVEGRKNVLQELTSFKSSGKTLTREFLLENLDTTDPLYAKKIKALMKANKSVPLEMNDILEIQKKDEGFLDMEMLMVLKSSNPEVAAQLGERVWKMMLESYSAESFLKFFMGLVNKNPAEIQSSGKEFDGVLAQLKAKTKIPIEVLVMLFTFITPRMARADVMDAIGDKWEGFVEKADGLVEWGSQFENIGDMTSAALYTMLHELVGGVGYGVQWGLYVTGTLMVSSGLLSVIYYKVLTKMSGSKVLKQAEVHLEKSQKAGKKEMGKAVKDTKDAHFNRSVDDAIVNETTKSEGLRKKIENINRLTTLLTNPALRSGDPAAVEAFLKRELGLSDGVISNIFSNYEAIGDFIREESTGNDLNTLKSELVRVFGYEIEQIKNLFANVAETDIHGIGRKMAILQRSALKDAVSTFAQAQRDGLLGLRAGLNDNTIVAQKIDKMETDLKASRETLRVLRELKALESGGTVNIEAMGVSLDAPAQLARTFEEFSNVFGDLLRDVNKNVNKTRFNARHKAPAKEDSAKDALRDFDLEFKDEILAISKDLKDIISFLKRYSNANEVVKDYLKEQESNPRLTLEEFMTNLNTELEGKIRELEDKFSELNTMTSNNPLKPYPAKWFNDLTKRFARYTIILGVLRIGLYFGETGLANLAGITPEVDNTEIVQILNKKDALVRLFRDHNNNKEHYQDFIEFYKWATTEAGVHRVGDALTSDELVDAYLELYPGYKENFIKIYNALKEGKSALGNNIPEDLEAFKTKVGEVLPDTEFADDVLINFYSLLNLRRLHDKNVQKVNAGAKDDNSIFEFLKDNAPSEGFRSGR